MLKTFLTTQPYTKFVLIKDTVQEQGGPIFDFLVQNHLNRALHRLQYCAFHGSFARTKKCFVGKANVVLNDFTSDVFGWNSEETKDFEVFSSKMGSGDVVIIDSLAHMIYQYGISETYRFINNLKSRRGVQQIIALLHVDLLEDADKICPLFEHLCTLDLSVEPKFISNNGRAHYTHKKSGGKVIKQMEEYRFEGNDFITQKIEKPDYKKLLERSMAPAIDPETLSTFRIGLSEEEKASRDKLVLPYLPKDQSETEPEEGKIFYEFDDVDDWDEEDPDDDLDI